MATLRDMTRQLAIGISPCPNDTFIFHGLHAGRIDAAPFTFTWTLADVDELNRLARAGALDVVKVSTAAYPAIAERYALLTAGGALGRGCGPLVVARPETPAADIASGPLAVPGLLTTGNLLAGLSGRFAGERLVLRYDAVMPAVIAGRAAAGVVIHEGRFTYAAHGLVQLLDLGAWWEETTGLPIPLGSIAVRRDLGADVARHLDARIRQSLDLTNADPEAAWPFISENAIELAPEVVRAHIATFVTPESRGLTPEGRLAVTRLLAEGFAAANLPDPGLPVFLT